MTSPYHPHQVIAIPAKILAPTPPVAHPIIHQAVEQLPAIPVANTAPTPLIAHPMVTQAVDPLATLDTNTSTSIGPHDTSQNIPNNTHSMTTRAKYSIVKPKIPTDGTTKYPLPHSLLTKANLDLVEPTCYSSTIKHPQWRKAMNCEFDALLQNQTWKLVSPSKAQNIVGCKWVFRIKRRADGLVERYKAHLVAKGFHQQPNVDFSETFSPIIKPTTVRTVLFIAISNG
jgi:hypothetical protein